MADQTSAERARALLESGNRSPASATVARAQVWAILAVAEELAGLCALVQQVAGRD